MLTPADSSLTSPPDAEGQRPIHAKGQRPIHASDVRNLDRCERLVTLGRRQERQPARAGSAAALGTHVHAAVDRTVRTGELPDERTKAGRIALELVPHIPANVLGSEVPFHATWRGIVLGGTIDLVAVEPLVLDWKTTGDWRRMLPTLAGDPQATWYSEAYDQAAGEVPDLRWVYVHTTSLQTRKLDGRISRGAIGAYERTMVDILTLDQLADPLEARANRAECGRFGGCEFLPRCGLATNAERFDGGAMVRAHERGVSAHALAVRA